MRATFLTRLKTTWMIWADPDAGIGHNGGPPLDDKKAPMREAAGVTVDTDEEEGWRRLSGDASRDLNPLTQKRMRETAVYLLRSNPVANRLIELPVAYLLAEGCALDVDDEDGQKWLDAFWNDPINKMDINLPKYVRELAVFGEQCWVAFVNEMNGHMRLGYLDPGLIETVVKDPDNAAQAVGIVTTKNKKGEARRYKVIVNGPESVFSKRTQEIRATFTDGECFYFDINALVTDSRGKSDLLPVMDSLDAYDQALFGELERWSFQRLFVWDVTLKGATQEEVEARAKRVTTPKAGSLRVHNDSEAWGAVSPDLQAGDSDILARLFRNHILGGGTIPEHWYGGGGDVNRATAAEMDEPTLKILTMRQRTIRHMLEMVGQYQLYRRLDPTGPLPDPSDFDAELKPRAVFAEISAKDTSKYAAAFAQVVVGCNQAVEAGLLTPATAIELIAMAAKQLGVDVDAKQELEDAIAEADRKRNEDELPPLDLEDDAEAEAAE